MSETRSELRTVANAFAIVMLLASVCGGAQAQAPTAAPTAAGATAEPAEPVPPELEPLPLSEVSSEAERIAAEIAELEALVAPSEAILKISEELTTLEVAIGDMEEDPVHEDPSSVSWSQLDSVLRQWRRLAGKLKAAEKQVAERSKVLEGRASGIAPYEELWKKTRESLVQQETPEPVIERVDAVLLDLADIQSALKRRQAEVFTLQNRISSDQLRVTQSVDFLSTAIVDVRGKIFARTDPPLWAAIGEDDTGLSLHQKWGKSWRRSRSDLEEFVQDFKDELLLHLVLTVVFMILIGRLGRRARALANEESGLRAAAAVLSRPISAGYVVSTAGVLLLYPDAPDTVYRIAYLSAALPLLLLVRAVVPAPWRRPLYGPIGLFVILHLGRLVPGLPLFQRLLYLVLTLAAVIGLAVLVRRFQQEGKAKAERSWRATIVTCRISEILLIVSIVANVIGMFELTILLTGGLFNSAYFAMVVVACVLILDGAVANGLKTEAARRLRMIRYHPEPIRKRLSAAIHIGGALMWVWVTLMIFDLSNFIKDWLLAVLGRQWTVGTLEFSIGGLLTFVLTIWVSVQISRFVRFALEQDVYPRVRLARGLPGTISMLVRYSILAIGFFIAVAAAGIPLSNFAIIVGALGVGIGFGLQNIVNNFISGLILAFERPIQIGDTVELGQVLGEVRMIGIRASNVRTFDGAEIIVPNGDLISGQVINWTLSDRRRRIRLNVGVAYGTDPQRVIDLLTEVAASHEDVWHDPKPTVLFRGFGESSLDFEMRFWTRKFDRWMGIQSDVAVMVNDALVENGIEIPFPQRDLHVRSVDEQAASALGGDPVRKPGPPEKKTPPREKAEPEEKGG